ncbi:MAG: Holliday junction resolvase RuvX [Anaerolineae bacterium]|nr:Holliday junction resolvase RuvX [Anaerolineae bacterium]
MRILGIDPGEINIGVALSDVTGTLARPLLILKHSSRTEDAKAITQLAKKHDVRLIIIGQSIDEDGQPTFTGRKARRLAGAVRTETLIPVDLWDESNSTQESRSARIAQGVGRDKRSGHLDATAAAIILQSYINTNL